MSMSVVCDNVCLCVYQCVSMSVNVDESERVDMTFSVTKSYLSTVAAIAYDDGIINLDDKLKKYVWDGKFDDPHNSRITWHHLLNQ